MPARKRSAASTPTPAAPTPARTRTTVALPATVATATNVQWPGSNRGRGASPLRAQLVEDAKGMTLGSVRRYSIIGRAEQNALVNLFRSAVDQVHDKRWGVQAALQDEAVFVRICERRANNRSS